MSESGGKAPVSSSEKPIPVIDFAEAINGGAGKAEVGDQLVRIFCSTGFVYLRNHGVDKSIIELAFEKSRDFFYLPLDVKLKCSRPPGTEANAGYVASGIERLNAFVDGEKQLNELREAYNFYPHDNSRMPTNLPHLESALSTLYDKSWKLTQDIFECLAVGLDLEDRAFFQNQHTLVGSPGNPTTLRTLWYPAFLASGDVANKVTRCGTHSDYGTLTLLYQDQIGGLEVENRSNVFVPAVPLQDCVLVNVADLLQRWTSDKLRSTRHRVTFGKGIASAYSRQSMAFFVHPDDSCVVECLDGSKKYPAVSAGTYLQEKFGQTY